ERPQGTDHRHHGPGRVLPRRAPARRGLPGVRHGPARLDRVERADRAPRRARHPAPGRPPGPVLARGRARGGPPDRGLQPRGAELRAHLVAAARAHRGVQRRGRHAHARGDPHGGPLRALLPGVVVRDVRQGARGAAERADAVLPALAVRRGQGLRALHHRELPRVVRPVRRLGHPLQPRVTAPRARVRDAQDHGRRGPDQARPGRRAAPRQPRRQARLGLRRRLRPGHADDAAPPRADGLRRRERRGAQRARPRRAGVRARRSRPGAPRPRRPGLRPADRVGPPGRRRLQGAPGARLGAARVVPGDGRDDGRRRPGASRRAARRHRL
ncbi:MAG: GDP-mannose 4,6-dehydratase, partial [uncultured Thermoleophilia bacterium]